MSIWRVIWDAGLGRETHLDFITPHALVWFLKRHAQKIPFVIRAIEELT